MPPAQRRSKTGCLTCRSRGKKCPEDWDDQGRCSRCIYSAYTCRRAQYNDVPPQKQNGTPKQTAINGMVNISTELQQQQQHPQQQQFQQQIQQQLQQQRQQQNDSFAFLAADLFNPSGFNEQSTSSSTPTNFATSFGQHSSSMHHNFGGFPTGNLLHSSSPLASATSPSGSTPGIGFRTNAQPPPRPPDVSLAEMASPAPELTTTDPSRVILELYLYAASFWTNTFPPAQGEYVKNLLIESHKHPAIREARIALMLFVYEHDTFNLGPDNIFTKKIPQALNVTRENATSLAKEYAQKALAHLSNPNLFINDLISELVLATDLAFYFFVAEGTAETRLTMEITGNRLLGYLGPMGTQRPLVNFYSLSISDFLAMKWYLLAHYMDCIVHRGRLPSIELESTTNVSEGLNIDYESYLEPPFGLIEFLGRITQLAHDIQNLSKEETTQKADEIETALRKWSPQPLPPADSRLVIGRAYICECWRHTCIIILYQSVHKVKALHPKLKNSLATLINLFKSPPPMYPFIQFFMYPVVFFACTIAVNTEDREVCEKIFDDTMIGKGQYENRAVIDKVWKETDETGTPIDWHEIVTRDSMNIAFI